jgi:hypothetical protein
MQSPLRTTETSPVPWWFGTLLMAGLWMLGRPYFGLRHDGILYMGQSLLQLQPGSLSSDLFFVYGSQDRFSLFSNLVARMYAAWGMAATQTAVLAVCHVSLMVMLARLLRPLPVQQRWLSLAAVAVLAHSYGGWGIFAFGESFVTARTLAEPLALAALVCVVEKRLAPGLVLLLLAGLAHPLVALPTAVLIWILICGADRRWLWAAVLALLPLALAWAGKAPFDGLLRIYDDTWWQQVVLGNKHVVLSEWLLGDWQVLALDAGILWVALRAAPQPLAGLAGAALLAGSGFMAVSAVGADLVHNVLLTGLQVWRGLWLVHLLALAFAPIVWLHLWRGAGPSRLVALAFAAAMVAVNGRWDAGWAFLLWWGATALLLRKSQALSPLMARAAFWTTGAAVIALTLAIGVKTVQTMQDLGMTMDHRTIVLVAVSLPALSLPLAAIVLRQWRTATAPRVVLATLSVLFVSYAASGWDRRPAWIRYLESSIQAEHPFARYIPPNAQVYWDSDLAAEWALLRRPSYFTMPQGSGLLFNRETAAEFARRQLVLSPILVQRQLCLVVNGIMGDSKEPEDCAPELPAIEALCRAQGGPDFLVLSIRLPRGVISEWTFQNGPGSKTYYLYDCIQLR